jgi:uncharacterized protein with HEPN domain
MNEQDEVRLRHMLDAAREAIHFAEGHSLVELKTNRMLALALVKDIEIIGEAASRLTEECQATNPQIPWVDIAGMRNRLIHAYFDINLRIVWDTVTVNLPPLIAELEKLIPLEDDGDS